MKITNEITTQWSGKPLKKLEALLTDGWQVCGVSIEKTTPVAPCGAGQLIRDMLEVV